MSSIDFSSNEAKASYGIGLQMGQQVHSAFSGVAIDAVVAGVQDAFAGKESQVSNEELNAAFQEIQKIVEAENAEKAKKFAAEGEAFLTENAKREEVNVLESGLQYEVITEGSGDVPTAASTVRTHYAGTLVDGSEFDSSYKRGEPAEFPVGGVIPGWTEALQKMAVGSKWKLYVPYNLAYGEQGAGGAIGPYQALVFEIELLEIIA